MSELVFPMEKAKKLRDQPRDRYEFAVQYLPLPGAFREAAKGLRAIVRERKRNDERYEEPLRELYALACVKNLVDTPIPSRGYPGPALGDPLPVELWRDLEFSYEEIGYENLDLLGTRDRGRIRKLWGEPDQHQDVGEVVSDIVLQRFAAHTQAIRTRRETELQERLERVRLESESKPEASGCLVLLGASVGGLLALLV